MISTVNLKDVGFCIFGGQELILEKIYFSYMWKYTKNQLDNRTLHFKITENEVLLSYRQVLELWKSHPDFRKFYTQLLRDLPFDAGFWECRPVTKSDLGDPFEFVFINGPVLNNVPADKNSFRNQFAQNTKAESVISFMNLGKDARLVVPAPNGPEKDYVHLLRFLRNAPEAQIDLFWQKVGEAMQERISDKKVWLSTAGLGVFWLHVRMDSRPKYYRFNNYK